MAVEAWHTAFPRPRANRSMDDSPFWSRSAKDFRPRVKQMLTRAAVACLVRPNARKAYSLVLSRIRPAMTQVRACNRPPFTSCKLARDVGQMSAIEAVVITAIGTAAAVVWALCLEAWDKKSPPRA